jgi:hypothetical protein
MLPSAVKKDNEMTTDRDEAVSDLERARRGVFVVLSSAGINSRDDRLEVAGDILGRPVNSFRELDKDDIFDLHFALQSWKRIQAVRMANNALLGEAVDLVRDLLGVDLSEEYDEWSLKLPLQDDE